MDTCPVSFVLMLGFLVNTPAMSAQSSDEAAIAQAVESLRKAALSKDRSQFDALLSDQLSYGHSTVRVETEKEFIHDATGPTSVWKFIETSNQTIHVTGNNAIVLHNLAGETESAGKTSAVKDRRTDGLAEAGR